MKKQHYISSNATSRKEIKKFLSMYINQSDAAKCIGITRSYLNQVIRGLRPLSVKVAKKIQQTTKGKISAERLLCDKDIYIPNFDSFREHFIVEYIYPIAYVVSIEESAFYEDYTHDKVKAVLEKNDNEITADDVLLLSALYCESPLILQSILSNYQAKLLDTKLTAS